jgi:hypothetical protein
MAGMMMIIIVSTSSVGIGVLSIRLRLPGGAVRCFQILF